MVGLRDKESDQVPPTNECNRVYRDARHLTWVYLMLVVLVGTALMASFFLSPDAIDRGAVVFTPTCPTKSLFGRPCPTCGMTRGFAALSHGDFRLATRYNRAAPVVYVAGWGILVLGIIGVLRSARAARTVRKGDPA